MIIFALSAFDYYDFGFLIFDRRRRRRRLISFLNIFLSTDILALFVVLLLLVLSFLFLYCCSWYVAIKISQVLLLF
jgi:hypothetical protein